ncbi:MAG: S8 family serine peptidase [Eubacterium sp.]|nr:S8 family serine peptidase [Eubacterium sp.]
MKKAASVLLCLVIIYLSFPNAVLFAKADAETAEYLKLRALDDCEVKQAESIEEALDAIDYMERSFNNDNQTDSETASMRIAVEKECGELKNDYGASAAVRDFNGVYFLQYKSEEDAVRAFECFEKEGGNSVLCYDHSVETTGYISSDWGHNQLESEKFISYLEEKNLTENKIVVAVVDTGLTPVHPIFNNRVLEGYNVFDKNSDYSDCDTHGTYISGIIANNTPSNVKILPVRAFTTLGGGNSLPKSNGSSAYYGIIWAVEHGANIINMSFVGECTSDSCLEKKAIDYATKNNVVCVAGAGNDAAPTDNKCPARLDNTITVSACGEELMRAAWSNYGKAVDFCCPGESVVSTKPNSSGSGLSAIWGTSFAAPYACAVAADILCENRGLTPVQVKEKMKALAIDAGYKGKDWYYGYGILGFQKALGSGTTSIETAKIVPNKTVNYIPHSPYYLKDKVNEYCVNMLAEPKNCIDRSYTVESSDESVIYCDGIRFITHKTGEALLTFKFNNNISVEYYVCVTPSVNWIDYASKDYGGGNGSVSNPYLVSKPEHLAKMAKDCLLGDMKDRTYFKQTNDIDLSGHYWYPITPDSDQKPKIYYDGGANSIKNLNDTDNNKAVVFSRHGIFGVNYGLIENINLQNAVYDNVVGTQGGICGQNCGIIRKCNVDAIMKAYNNDTGGICGRLSEDSSFGEAIVENCTVNAEITSERGNSTGGLVGQIDSGLVTNCISKTKITKGKTTSLQSGGLVDNLIGGKIINCVSSTNAFGYASKKAMAIRCYAVSNDDNLNGKDNIEIILTESNFADNVQNYQSATLWDNSYPWDFNSDWQITDGELKQKTAQSFGYANGYSYIFMRDGAMLIACDKATEKLSLPSSVNSKSVKYIANNFILNGKTKEVVCPDSLKTIEKNAFFGSSIKKITLNEGLKKIGNRAFCSSELKDFVSIPKSVEIVESNAFQWANSLKFIVFYVSDCEGFSEFMADERNPESITICYPEKFSKSWSGEKWSKAKTKAYAPDDAIYINFDESDVYIDYGKSKTLKANIANKDYSGGALLWSSGDKSQATVDKNGKVTVKGRYWTDIVVKTPNKKLSASIAVYCKSGPDFTVAFSKNGGKGKMKAQKIGIHTANVKINANEFFRKGYHFVGWAKEPTGAVAYKNKANLYTQSLKIGSTTTLYAKWSANKYTVKFKANGGKGKMDSQEFKYNKKKKLASVRFKAPKGKRFAGWATSKGGKVKYKNAQSVKNLTSKNKGTVTLYAVWKKK